MRIDAGAGKVAARPSTQQPVVDEGVGDRLGVPSAHLCVGQRQLRCRAEQLRPEHIGISGVDDHSLDRLVQQRFRMVDQIGVQWVVARDQQNQRALPAPAGPSGLLPERRHGAGEAGKHDGVQPRDVDTEFEGVGTGQAAQIALGQCAFQRAPVLGEVTGAIGRHPARQLGRDVLQPRAGTQRGEFGAAAGPDERQRAGAFGDQVGHHPCRLGAGGTPYRCAVFADQVGAQRGLPQRDGARTLR